MRNETRQGFGGHQGVVSDFSADFIVPVSRAITVSAGPRFTWESTKAVAPYFGIDAVQAMASGLPMYDAKGGAHSAGAGAQVQYRINPQWEVHSYVEYERLLGDAANSPLVTARGSVNQTTVGIGASYSFDIRIQVGERDAHSQWIRLDCDGHPVLHGDGNPSCPEQRRRSCVVRDPRRQAPIVKTVGIISAIGDQFTFEKAGLTGLDNSPRSGPIASWGLDDLMAQQVTDALSIRFQMQPVTYPRATFATTRESAITAVNLVRGDPFKKLVQTEVSPQGLDAYIVITKAKAYSAAAAGRSKASA